VNFVAIESMTVFNQTCDLTMPPGVVSES
jgi:hypothetical protein